MISRRRQRQPLTWQPLLFTQRYRKAIRLYSAALDLADEHNNSNLIEVSLTNLASLYVISKRHISNDLLQRIELSARQDTVYGYHTLTDVSLLKNHIDSARYYLELAKAHTTDICDMAELQYTAYHIEAQAKILKSNGQCTSLYLLERFNNALKHAILRRYGRAGLF